MHPVTADEALRAAFVSFLKHDGKTVVGGGVLIVGEDQRALVLTCAHVVNTALGRDQFETSEPRNERVIVAWPAAPGAREDGRVVGWWPARSLRDADGVATSNDRRWRGDVALLEVGEALPARVRPVPLANPQLEQEAWTWFGSGEPTSVVRTRVSGIADDWLVLGGASTGHAVQPGYSGSPLWDRERQAVVGLLVSAHQSKPYARLTTADATRQSYAIRADSIAERCLGRNVGRSEPQRDDIEAVLEAQRSAARAFPYQAVGLHGRDPATVYVRQQVSTSTPGKLDPTVEPNKTIEDALATHRHVFLTGEAGSGKSTLTIQLSTRRIVLPDEAGQVTLLPLRVLARDLASRPGMRFLTAVYDALQAGLARFMSRETPSDLLERSSQAVQWLIIVDGLDEVTARLDRVDLIERIRIFMEQERAYRVLVTSRPLPEVERPVWTESKEVLTQYVIEPFRQDQLSQFARAWFAHAPQLSGRFLGQVVAAGFEEEASNPLLATVAAVVFEEDPEQPLPASRFDLYERYFSYLYDSRARQLLNDLQGRLAGRHQAQELTHRLVAARVSLVEHLAPLALGRQSLLAEALQWLAAKGITPKPAPPDWSEIVASVLTSTGLVVPDGEGLQFTHHTFAEHICDLLDARRLPARFDPDDATWWRTVSLACMTGDVSQQRVILHRALLGGDPTHLLDWLLQGNDLSRELAGALISRGVHATGSQHLDLARTVDFWIWRASRSPQHVSQTVNTLAVLRDLSRPLHRVVRHAAVDPAVPGELREAAAHVLLRCGEPYRSDGLDVMHRFVRDAQLAGRIRLRAAHALEFAGATQAALEGLAHLTRDRSVHALHRHIAADLLNGRRSWSSLPARTAAGTVAIDARPLSGARPDGSDEDLRQPSDWTDVIAPERGWHRDEPTEERARPFGPEPVPSSIVVFLALDDGADAEDVAALALGIVAAQISYGPPRGTHGHKVREETGMWASIAMWLTRQPAPLGSPYADFVLSLLADIVGHSAHASAHSDKPYLGRPMRAVLAALLLRGEQEHKEAGLRLLTAPMAMWSFPSIDSMMRDALWSSQQTLLKPVVTQLCRILLDSRLTNILRLEVLASVRALDADAAVEFLTRAHDADPYRVATTIVRLGREYHPEAVAFLEESARGSLDGSAENWCRAAAELLATAVSSHRDETARMLQRVVTRAPNNEAALAVAAVLGLHDPMAASRCAARVADAHDANDADRIEAIRLIARLGSEREHETTVLTLLDSLGDTMPTRKLIDLTDGLSCMSPAVRDRMEILLRQRQARADQDPLHSTGVVTALAYLSSATRARLCSDLPLLCPLPSGVHIPGWLSRLKVFALLGPDLHEAVQTLLAAHVVAPERPHRIAATDLIHTLDWKGSGELAARSLATLATAPSELPATRALAARRLRRYGQTYRITALQALNAVAEDALSPPLLVMQIARELAATGAPQQAMKALATLCMEGTVSEPHRSKAALLMLILDPRGSPIATHALQAMASDRRLSAEMRVWANEVLQLVQDRPNH